MIASTRKIRVPTRRSYTAFGAGVLALVICCCSNEALDIDADVDAELRADADGIEQDADDISADAELDATDGDIDGDFDGDIDGDIDGDCPPPLVFVDGECLSPTCEPDTCNGHGRCDDSSGLPECTCDQGFTGSRCDSRSPNFYDRVMLVENLADPDVLEIDDDLFFMSGTQGGRTLPIYRSVDLFDFELSHHYDPTALDPEYDYCKLWAPDLSRYDGQYHIYFSAERVPQGVSCPDPDVTVTTFHATAPDDGLEFGLPEMVNPGTTYPRSRTAGGCPPEGCSRVIRIDSSIFAEGSTRWLFYVWFEAGNNISSFRLSSPGDVIHNTGPALFGSDLLPEEESINEGPDVFVRDGRYYLFFSGAYFNSQYAMFYVTAPSVEELTRRRYVRRHSRSIRGAGEALVQSHGHNTIVERRGERFNVFHQGVFDGGDLVRRDTHIQRIAFRSDGSLHTLNLVNVRWGELPGHDYSLDLVLRDGTVIGPCVSASVIGTSRSVTFGGICPSDSHQLVEKSRIAAFRVYYSNDGTWSGERSVEVAYDGISDDVFVPLPGATTREVALRWNELQTGAEYSLDVQRHDGSWVAPCDGESVIGTNVEHVYDGRCATAGLDVPLSQVQRLRICSAVDDDWAHARCGSAPFDSEVTHLDILIP